MQSIQFSWYDIWVESYMWGKDKIQRRRKQEAYTEDVLKGDQQWDVVVQDFMDELAAQEADNDSRNKLWTGVEGRHRWSFPLDYITLGITGAAASWRRYRLY